MNKLKFFDISDNNIKTVPDRLFEQMDDLILLDLGGNQIKSFDSLESIISPNKQPSLTISLAMNRLVYLKTSRIDLQEQTLILYGNPWNCTQWDEMAYHIDGHLSKCDTALTSSGKALFCFDLVVTDYSLNANKFEEDVDNYHNVVKNATKNGNCSLKFDIKRTLLKTFTGCVA